jgi:hypothetical protein
MHLLALSSYWVILMHGCGLLKAVNAVAISDDALHAPYLFR